MCPGLGCRLWLSFPLLSPQEEQPRLRSRELCQGAGARLGKPACGELVRRKVHWSGHHHPGARPCAGHARVPATRAAGPGGGGGGGRLGDAAPGRVGGAHGPGRSGVIRRAAPPGRGRRPRTRPGSMDRSSLLQLIQEQVRWGRGAPAPPLPLGWAGEMELAEPQPSPRSCPFPKPSHARPWPTA